MFQRQIEEMIQKGTYYHGGLKWIRRTLCLDPVLHLSALSFSEIWKLVLSNKVVSSELFERRADHFGDLLIFRFPKLGLSVCSKINQLMKPDPSKKLWII